MSNETIILQLFDNVNPNIEQLRYKILRLLMKNKILGKIPKSQIDSILNKQQYANVRKSIKSRNTP